MPVAHVAIAQEHPVDLRHCTAPSRAGAGMHPGSTAGNRPGIGWINAGRTAGGTDTPMGTKRRASAATLSFVAPN